MILTLTFLIKVTRVFFIIDKLSTSRMKAFDDIIIESHARKSNFDLKNAGYLNGCVSVNAFILTDKRKDTQYICQLIQ